MITKSQKNSLKIIKYTKKLEKKTLKISKHKKPINLLL